LGKGGCLPVADCTHYSKMDANRRKD